MITLRQPTDPRWIALALSRFDEVLVDHAHCEKKAAAHALSLLSSYPELPGLPLAMATLAREEAQHLKQVLKLLAARKLELGRDLGDPYAKGLYAQLRTRGLERRLDQLLISAIIEARSEERLRLLATHLADPALRAFYEDLALAEAGHAGLFVKLAARASPDWAARLEALLDAEAAVLSSLPLRAAVH